MAGTATPPHGGCCERVAGPRCRRGERCVGVGARAGVKWPRRRASGRRGGHGVAPELQEVAGGGDHAPFGARGGSAAAEEAVGAAVELRVGEDRLDHLLALPVKLAVGVGLEDVAHEGVAAAVPAWSGAAGRLSASGGINTVTPW